jgi:hypothetical protein
MSPIVIRASQERRFRFIAKRVAWACSLTGTATAHDLAELDGPVNTRNDVIGFERRRPQAEHSIDVLAVGVQHLLTKPTLHPMRLPHVF